MAKKNDVAIRAPWASQLWGLAGLVILGSLIAYYAPLLTDPDGSFFSRLETVSFQQVAALVLLAALSVIYLAYFRARYYFSTRWLTAAVAYSVLILFVKFTLSAHEVAGQAAASFGATLITAFLISLLYIAAFSVLYLFFDGRLLNKSLHKALIVSAEGKMLLAMGLFVCATLARILVFRLPGLSSTNASAYLSDIFKANDAILSALLFVMIIGAVEAFAQVRRRADLKYFYVSGTLMILTFHLWWAIFTFRGH